jgi:hypothetical protein
MRSIADIKDMEGKIGGVSDSRKSDPTTAESHERLSAARHEMFIAA